MRNIKKSQEINEQIEFGLDTIDPNRTVEIKLKDLMLIYKTFEELNRFFHQPMHYPTMEDINTFLGNKDVGAFSIIGKIYYRVLNKYIPKNIMEKVEEDFFSPENSPYYYKVKNDENIDDGTLNVIDRQSFAEFVEILLAENKQEWEVQNIEQFIENISAYAQDIDGLYHNLGFDTSAETPTWRIFAQILKGATIYE
ncbi:hypothetical protein QJU96_01560 [Pasteurella skyensis]|uniref:DUF7660 domain-containing protein n=1 Tax=Phocoenobacter skyensis TaxID=97481 RepID=A0AAJ6P1U8_9PAST|nr:hypothetical protein [Pasteurella skyensis]MDP8169975.1 hypothetical protein [Pasteurella skyensis]MDP8174089.1 hypothetical protein [Pasteurella skyensis]